LLPTVNNCDVEVSLELTSPKRKRPVTAAATGDGIARVSKRRKLVEVPISTSDETTRDAGSVAKDAHEPGTNIVAIQTKTAKRGRPAMEKKEVVKSKRQRITKYKRPSAEEISGQGVGTVDADDDHLETGQKNAEHGTESNKELKTTKQLKQEQSATRRKRAVPAPQKLASTKQAKVGARATTKTKDLQEVPVVVSEEEDCNIKEPTVRRARRAGPVPRYMESDGEEDTHPRKTKGTTRQAKDVLETSTKSKSTHKEEEAHGNQDNASRQKSSKIEIEDTAKAVPKRRRRPPKKGVASPVDIDLLDQVNKMQHETEPASGVQQPITLTATIYKEDEAKTGSMCDTLPCEVQQELRVGSQPKRRGRPPKVKTQAVSVIENEITAVERLKSTEILPDQAISSTKPKRGRPARTAARPMSTTTETAVLFTEDVTPMIQKTAIPVQTSSQAATKPTAAKRRGRPPKAQITTELIVEPTSFTNEKPADSSHSIGRPDVPILQGFTYQQDINSEETKPSTVNSKGGGSRKATMESTQKQRRTVREELTTNITNERFRLPQHTNSIKKPKVKESLAHAPNNDDEVQSTQEQSLAVRAPVLTARSANLLLSPRRTRTTKPKLPIFKMTSKRRAQGEWQKEDWFEPSVPATLLGSGL